MYMNEEASAFYLSRVLPFMSIAEIAKRLGVTRPTVERMAESWKVALKYQDGFERILDQLGNDFRKKAKSSPQPNFYTQLERGMMDREPSRLTGGEKDERVQEFLDEVTPLLRRTRGLNSKEVLNVGLKYRIPRQRVYRLTDQLGVRREVKGLGRNMVSTWYL